MKFLTSILLALAASTAIAAVPLENPVIKTGSTNAITITASGSGTAVLKSGTAATLQDVTSGSSAYATSAGVATSATTAQFATVAATATNAQFATVAATATISGSAVTAQTATTATNSLATSGTITPSQVAGGAVTLSDTQTLQNKSVVNLIVSGTGTVSGSTPVLSMRETLSNAYGTGTGHQMNLFSNYDSADPRHCFGFLAHGLMPMVGNGYYVSNPFSAWGAGWEIDFHSPSGDVHHEHYLIDGTGFRPFNVSDGQKQTGAISSIISGTVTTSAAHPYQAGNRFKFTSLSGTSGGIATETYYFVKTVPSATSFTYAATSGGAALTGHAASSGTYQSGGWSVTTINGPTQVSSSLLDYENNYDRLPYTFSVTGSTSVCTPTIFINNTGSATAAGRILFGTSDNRAGAGIYFDPDGNNNYQFEIANGSNGVIYTSTNGTVGVGYTRNTIPSTSGSGVYINNGLKVTGSASRPMMASPTDPDTGWYPSSAGFHTFSSDGAGYVTIGSYIGITRSSKTLNIDASTGGAFGNNCAIYTGGTNQPLYLTTSSATTGLLISATAATFYKPINVQSGTAAAPSNTTTPVGWVDVMIGGTAGFKLPVYQ